MDRDDFENGWDDAVTRPASGGSAGDPALAPLIRQLSTDGASLLRQEVSLAALEIRNSALTVAKESAIVAAGGFLIVLGLLILLVFVILALGRLLGGAYWLSTLIVGGLFVIAGAATLFAGRRALARAELKPRRTLETVRETREWAAANAERLGR